MAQPPLDGFTGPGAATDKRESERWRGRMRCPEKRWKRQRCLVLPLQDREGGPLLAASSGGREKRRRPS